MSDKVEDYEWYGFVPWGNFGDGKWRLGTVTFPQRACGGAFSSLNEAHEYVIGRVLEDLASAFEQAEARAYRDMFDSWPFGTTMRAVLVRIEEMKSGKVWL